MYFLDFRLNSKKYCFKLKIKARKIDSSKPSPLTNTKFMPNSHTSCTEIPMTQNQLNPPKMSSSSMHPLPNTQESNPLSAKNPDRLPATTLTETIVNETITHSHKFFNLCGTSIKDSGKKCLKKPQSLATLS
jgi:hypothetical protein